MAELLARILARIFGTIPTVHVFRTLKKYGLAWHICDDLALRRLRSDSNFTYGEEFLDLSLLKSELALAARSYEWAWVGASESLAVCFWLERDIKGKFSYAKSIMNEAETFISSDRLDDLERKHSAAVQEHNRPSEKQFKEVHPLLWRFFLRKVKPGSLENRPL